MKLKTRWLAVPLVMSGIAISGAGSKAEAQQQSRSVGVRVARFWRGEGHTLLEGVVGLPIAQSVRGVVLEVQDSTGKSLYSETWSDTVSAQAAALRALNAETTTPLQVVLQPGLYTLAVRRTEGATRDSAVVQVRGFASAPVISDVVVSSRMRVLAEGEKPGAAEVQRGRYAIERGTHVTVLPAEPKLWYYLELYPQGTDSVAHLEFRVIPQGKDSALVRVMRNVAVGARGTVDAAALVVQGLPPGDYTLGVSAKTGNREEQRTTTFTMGSFDTAPPTLAGAIEQPEASAASESALYDRYFAPTMMSDAEASSVVVAMTVGTPGPQVSQDNLQLTTEGKRRFLARYFARLPDPNPATPGHELVVEYLSRVRYVEREFKESQGGGRAGVKTDRGRIYLRYGPPDASQHIQVASSNRSVDVWKYTRRKSMKYAFLDESGFSNYNLVYTTDPAERTLPDWESRVHDIDTITQIVTF